MVYPLFRICSQGRNLISRHKPGKFVAGGKISGGYQRLYSISRGIVESGAKLVVLTALDMDANPNYDRNAAAVPADMGAFVGAVTPEELAGWMGKIIA